MTFASFLLWQTLFAQGVPSPGPGVFASAAPPVCANGYSTYTTAVIAGMGLSAGTYTSGMTVSGTIGLTIVLASFNGGGSGATATVALTGTNTIAGGTAIVVTAPGGLYSTAPTSATGSSGTATFVSGTPVVSTSLASLTNWPGLISLSNNSFKVVGSGGTVVNTTTQTVGARSLTVPADFLVTKTDCTQITGVEFEAYSGTAGTAQLWGNQAMAAVGTTVYIFTGNASVTTLQGTPSGAWNANYGGVWHVPDGSTLNAGDSTSNANNGTVNGATAAAGQVDGASASNGGGSQSISMGANRTTLQPIHTITVECWVKPLSATQVTNATMIQQDANSPGAFGGVSYALELSDNHNPGKFAWRYSLNGGIANYIVSTVPFVNGTWAHVAGTYNSGSTNIYVDGVLSTTSMQGSTIDYVNTGVFGLLGYGTGTNEVNAALDECRVMTVASTPAWIAADYQNQLNPGTFWTLTYAQTN